MYEDMIKELKFDEHGLIPAIIQDYDSRRVLTLAYMNKESLEVTLSEGRTCFWSRSRRGLWRKGETSGNFQKVVSIRADCDKDSLIVEVIKEGPACHLGGDSCFDAHEPLCGGGNSLPVSELYALLQEREQERPRDSYTTYLFEKGKEKILKKIGEESAEVLIAAMKSERSELIFELSDLCYHALVLMVSEDIGIEDIRTELASRHVIDKKTKQETMK